MEFDPLSDVSWVSSFKHRSLYRDRLEIEWQKAGYRRYGSRLLEIANPLDVYYSTIFLADGCQVRLAGS